MKDGGDMVYMRASEDDTDISALSSLTPIYDTYDPHLLSQKNAQQKLIKVLPPSLCDKMS